MMPNITRGSRMAGLVMYLAGPGRTNEHENPHIVVGDDLVTFQVKPGKELTSDDALDIANIMNRPAKLYGTEVTVPKTEQDPETGERVIVGRKPAGVWHCSLSLKADEGRLTDEQWNQLSTEFVQKMGFTDREGEQSSRWVAIRHGLSKAGNDHVHIAVQMVREDGTKANVHNDFSRAQKACHELEKKYGLTVLESREQGRSPAADKPAERHRAERQGRPQADRLELRRRLRSALATASTESEYVQHVLDAGVRVQPYYRKGSNRQIAGYRVALPPTGAGEARAFWYAPSKLDPALAWTRIQQRYEGRGRDDAETLMQSLHSRQTPQPDRGSKLGGFSPDQTEQLISGKATTDTLANVYARVSMSVETKHPGTFARLSEEFSRAGYSHRGSTGRFLHGARVMQRAGTNNRPGENSGPGWIALIQQANRLARMSTTTSTAAASRPPWGQQAQWNPQAQWGQRVAEAVTGAEKFVSTQTTSTTTTRQPAVPGASGPRPSPQSPTAGRHTRPRRNNPYRGRPQRGNTRGGDQDYGR